MDKEHQQQETKYYTAYAEELREAFRGGFLSEFTHLRQPQFVLWRQQLIDGKVHKPPFDPKTGKLADTANPDSWGSLDQALQRLQTGFFNGIGVVFAKKDPRYAAKKPDPFAGIDLDHCVGNNRSIDGWARQFIDFLHTHTHYSPRDGMHLIMEVGEDGLPGPNRKIGNIEFFDSNHYLTVTPHAVAGTPKTIEPRRIEAGYLYFSVVPPELWPEQKNTRGTLSVSTPPPKQYIALNPETSDEAIIREALEETQGNFARYWHGGTDLWEGQDALVHSKSEADFVLILMLLTKTHDNTEQTKRLFLKSGLFDPKKSERFTGRDPTTFKPVTYLDMTIRNALKKRRAREKNE